MVNNCNDDDHQQFPLKSYETILKQEIEAGLAEFKRPSRGLALSAFSAGLDTGFSVLLMGVAITVLGDGFHPALVRLVLANCYAIGFILVILGRSELFTEHTALAVLPVLDQQKGLVELSRVWAIVFAGNILGAALFASIMCFVTPRMGIVEPAVFVEIAETMLGHPWWIMFLSGVLAGWLMGELGWLLGAARDTISQIVCVWIVTASIGAVGLHHCVVGTVEVLAGVLVSDSHDLWDFIVFLTWTTLGNAVGGVVFVAMLKYGHAVRGKNDGDDA